VRDESAPSSLHVLRQSAAVPKSSYPLCLRNTPSLLNGFVEVKFKTLGGTIDQAAGIVFRAQDATDYYICRANALEDNVVLYTVEDGKRKALDILGRQGGYGVEVKVPPAQWHTLRVEFTDARFKVFLNGQPLFEVQDSTFTKPGRVGLWTKADSVTAFDDFCCGP
jgi:hypothetical protein